MNSVILIGRLARDPELTYTPNTQTACCRLTLAVDRPKRSGEVDGAGYVRSADFIRVIVWNKQAEHCDRYLAKGRQVAVSGRITTGSYKDRNGQTVYTTDVTAERVEFLGSNQQTAQQQAYPPQQNNTFNTGSGEKAHIDPEVIASYRSEQNDTQMRMESQFNGFDDLPYTFVAAEDDIPF